jgi:uncharacterized Zn-finger protein
MVDKTLRPFNCEFCNLTFTSKQFLKRHYVVHTDDRNYECSVCKKSYKYKKGLNRHYKKHHSNYYNTNFKQLPIDCKLDVPLKQETRNKEKIKNTRKIIKKEDIGDSNGKEIRNELAALLIENEMKIFTTTPFPS